MRIKSTPLRQARPKEPQGDKSKKESWLYKVAGSRY